MMQARTVGRVTDVHTWTLSNGLEAFEHLDGIGAVITVVYWQLLFF